MDPPPVENPTITVANSIQDAASPRRHMIVIKLLGYDCSRGQSYQSSANNQNRRRIMASALDEEACTIKIAKLG
jgi:hypothetical protein